MIDRLCHNEADKCSDRTHAPHQMPLQPLCPGGLPILGKPGRVPRVRRAVQGFHEIQGDDHGRRDEDGREDGQQRDWNSVPAAPPPSAATRCAPFWPRTWAPSSKPPDQIGVPPADAASRASRRRLISRP